MGVIHAAVGRTDHPLTVELVHADYTAVPDFQERFAHELRHTFVSLLPDHGVSVEEISLLVGHDDTDTTEHVHRHQSRPVRRSAAKTMDEIPNDVGRYPARPHFYPTRTTVKGPPDGWWTPL